MQIGKNLNRGSIKSIGRYYLCSLNQIGEENIIKLSGGVALLWIIWKERNSRISKETQKSTIKTFGKIFAISSVCGLANINCFLTTIQSQSL